MIVMTAKDYAKMYASAVLNAFFEDDKSEEYEKALKNLQTVIDSDSFIQQVGNKEFGFDHDPEVDAQTDLGGPTNQGDYPNELNYPITEALVRRLIEWMKLEIKPQIEEKSD